MVFFRFWVFCVDFSACRSFCVESFVSTFRRVDFFVTTFWRVEFLVSNFHRVRLISVQFKFTVFCAALSSCRVGGCRVGLPPYQLSGLWIFRFKLPCLYILRRSETQRIVFAVNNERFWVKTCSWLHRFGCGCRIKQEERFPVVTVSSCNRVEL